MLMSRKIICSFESLRNAFDPRPGPARRWCPCRARPASPRGPSSPAGSGRRNAQGIGRHDRRDQVLHQDLGHLGPCLAAAGEHPIAQPDRPAACWRCRSRPAQLAAIVRARSMSADGVMTMGSAAVLLAVQDLPSCSSGRVPRMFSVVRRSGSADISGDYPFMRRTGLITLPSCAAADASLIALKSKVVTIRSIGSRPLR